jgi:hypothetical protein
VFSRISGRENSGGASSHAPPHLAARGLTRRARITGKWVGLTLFLLLFPSLQTVRSYIICNNNKKRTNNRFTFLICSIFQICFVFFFFLSNLLLLHIGMLYVSSSSSPLLQVPDRAAPLAGGESVAAAGLVAAAGGCLAAEEGKTRWLKREPWV